MSLTIPLAPEPFMQPLGYGIRGRCDEGRQGYVTLEWSLGVFAEYSKSGDSSGWPLGLSVG